MRGLTAGGFLGIIALLVSGCASGSGATGAAHDGWQPWADRQGGLLAGPLLDRVTQAGARLRPGAAPAHVLACDRPCAYAWPDGNLFITRALVLMLDDEELCAVLAHEIGHLRADDAGAPGRGGAPVVRALNGADAIEERADASACRLLRCGGIPPGSLSRALSKVRDAPSTPPACRAALSRRISVLDESLRITGDGP